MKKLETSLGGQDYNTDLTYFRWGKRCTNPYLWHEDMWRGS